MLLTAAEIRSLVDKGQLVQDMVDASVQVQQCGVDLTAANVFTLEGEGALDFSNEKRKIPRYQEVPRDGDCWRLQPGVYHIAFNERIVLPNNIAGFLMPRSSALTCGLVQHTAVWDPGYQGRAFFHIEVSRPVTVYPNARLGQMIFIKLSGDTAGYTGMYRGEDILKFAQRGGNPGA